MCRISKKNRVINMGIQSPSDDTYCQPLFINHHMTSRSQLFLPIIFTYSWAQQIWRSPGIMTILVTCLNPAIGSGFMLPDYMYELMSGEQCQIWYTAAWRMFLFCKLGYREVFMPLLFITLALEWHIFNHYYLSARAQVWSSLSCSGIQINMSSMCIAV